MLLIFKKTLHSHLGFLETSTYFIHSYTASYFVPISKHFRSSTLLMVIKNLKGRSNLIRPSLVSRTVHAGDILSRLIGITMKFVSSTQPPCSDFARSQTSVADQSSFATRKMSYASGSHGFQHGYIFSTSKRKEDASDSNTYERNRGATNQFIAAIAQQPRQIRPYHNPSDKPPTADLHTSTNRKQPPPPAPVHHNLTSDILHYGREIRNWRG